MFPAHSDALKHCLTPTDQLFVKLCNPGIDGPGAIVAVRRRVPLVSLVVVVCASAFMALPATSSAETEGAVTSAPKAAATEPVATTSAKSDASKSDATSTKSSDKTSANKSSDSKSFEYEKLPAAVTNGDDSKTESKKESGSGALGRMLIGLFFVLALIYGVHWLLKKYGGKNGNFSGGAAGVIDVLATTQLAPTRALHLIRVGNEVVLIGATDQSITQLRSFDDAAAANATASALGGEDFARALQASMTGNTGGTAYGNFGASSIAGMTPASTTPAQTNDSFLRRFLANLQLYTAR
jgi:flagellar protein FliO/FliZ